MNELFKRLTKGGYVVAYNEGKYTIFTHGWDTEGYYEKMIQIMKSFANAAHTVSMPPGKFSPVKEKD